MSERMAIQTAWVDDPLVGGKLLQPIFCVEVNVMPDVTIPDEVFDGGWTVGKYGPFIKYTHGHQEVNAGDFNMRFAKRFPPVVDISLFQVGKDEPSTLYALNVKRARALLRKYAADWRLLLADRDAQEGVMIWFPTEKDPVCKYWTSRQQICGQQYSLTVPVDGIDVPVCSQHRGVYNSRQAVGRQRRDAS